MSAVLRERVANATKAEDLLPIFKALPIQALRNVAIDAIERMSANERKAVQLKTCSIHKIIGNDVMQKILSFIPYNSAVQCVDKTFKSLNGKNAEMRMNQRNKLVNNNNFFETDFEKNAEFIFHLNDSNNIDSPKQFLLTKREISSNYVDNREVCHSFEDILTKDFNKIIIFVEEGNYTLLDDESYYFECIAIIGISDNVRIKLFTNACDKDFRFDSGNVYIENVSIVPSEDVQHICLMENMNFWIKKSAVFVWISIEDTNFYAKKCKFVNTNNDTYSALIRSDNNASHNFSVLGCTFTTMCDVSAFIEIAPHEGVLVKRPENAGNIRIIGNIFEGKCLESAIAAMPPDLYGWTDVDITDWNEPRIKIYFSNHKTIEYNVVMRGHNIEPINPNKIRPKQIKW